MQNFECKRGELTIRGRVLGDTSKKSPAIIMSHGFKSNYTRTAPYAEALSKQGYVCYIFDFCGGGVNCTSDGRHRDMTIWTEVDDLLAVIDYVKAQPSTGEIILLGASQGGFVSSIVAKRQGAEKIAKLINLYPALCIPDDARKGQMQVFKFDPNNIPELIGTEPMEIGREYARTMLNVDAFEEISGYAGPVLYLHGDQDAVVDISYARKAKDGYPNCEYHEIVGAGHGFRDGDFDLAVEYISEFMKK